MNNSSDIIKENLVEIKSYGKSVVFSIAKPDDHIEKHIANNRQFYELDLLDELFHRSLPGMRFVDVGANIGNHAIFFSAVAGLNGTAIEPVELNYERLIRNVKLNRLEKNIEILCHAVGEFDTDGEYVSPSNNNLGMCYVIPKNGGNIKIKKIDSLRLKDFHILKVDVEGFEIDVLRGAINSIKKYRPVIICEAADARKFTHICKFLEGLRYKPSRRYCVTPTYIFEPSRRFFAGL